MKRWLLTAALATGVFALAQADDPKANPFRSGKVEVKEADKKNEDKDTSIARIAHIKLSGDLDESPVPEESLFGPPAENLYSKLGHIRKAAKDDRIAGLLLQIDEPAVGFGKLNEIKEAISTFKKTGKKVFVYAEEFSAKGYLLALGADGIYIPESGGIMLVGMRAEVTFYKNTLDLLRLKMDVAKVGNYKSAVEPFLKDSMSDANREQIQSMLNDNFDNEIIQPMIAARTKAGQKWTPQVVEAIIDQGPFTAKKSIELGLVDAVCYEDELDKKMADALKAKSVKIEKNYGKPKAAKMDFSNPLAMLDMLGGGSKKEKESSADKIAVIYAVGSITSGKSGSGNPLMGGGESVGSETIVEAVRKAENDRTVKAIVLRIDSPGGSALASDVMWRELKNCKKPVIASMGDVAASGGYYIAMPCKKIFAEPGTITGSIGVFGMKLVTNGLQEWGGMKTEIVSRGKNSGIMSSTFPWTESEKKAMEENVDAVYDLFTTKALEGRLAAGQKMTLEQLKSLAGGRVWTGRQAKANGLVDELGTLNDAIAAAKTMAGIDPKKDMELLTLPKAHSFLDKLMDGEAKLPFGAMSVEMLKSIPDGDKVMKILTPLLSTQKDPVKVLLPFHVEFK
ncbi:signal peptide peptidase SppA [soil metagenome]